LKYPITLGSLRCKATQNSNQNQPSLTLYSGSLSGHRLTKKTGAAEVDISPFG